MMKSENTNTLQVEHLSKSFGDEPVLKDISFMLAPGENLVILGKSGEGKSVLLKCVSGLIPPDDGRIALFGQWLHTLDEESLNRLRKRLGFVFQGAALYDSLSLRENLLFHLDRSLLKLTETEKNERIREILDKVGLAGNPDKMPGELSGGMCKRAGLARALVLRPEVILYDEPTTGLDPATARGISELIMRIRKVYNTSSVIVTHDMSCASLTADRVLVLENGSFVAEGTYEQLKKNQMVAVLDFFSNP
jgi:phospholipid/cholesterol/gamma-HCH transport system ATP-binding protein